MNILPALHRVLRPALRRGPAAILFTGGLDSTTLALAAAGHHPRLFFGAVDHKTRSAYNAESIRICRQAARCLGLTFRTVPIRREDYRKNFLPAFRNLPVACTDTDLPAARCLFLAARRAGCRVVLSGMGADALFSRSGAALRRQARHAVLPPIVAAHVSVAADCGLIFVCPFLAPAVVAWAGGLTPQERTDKTALRTLLAQHPALAAITAGRAPAHSLVPEAFLPSGGRPGFTALLAAVRQGQGSAA